MSNDVNISQYNHEFKKYLVKLNHYYLNLGCQVEDLEKAWISKKCVSLRTKIVIVIIILVAITLKTNPFSAVISYVLGIRCILPNNYFIWEATRPIKDCSFCENVSEPIILNNLTQSEFFLYAYSSKPIVIKQAFLHWSAINTFSLDFFKKLYNKTEDGYRSVDEECQFLHFKSNFISIQDVFSMSEERSHHPHSDASWYVGW